VVGSLREQSSLLLRIIGGVVVAEDEDIAGLADT